MNCPNCGKETIVKDSRKKEDTVMRRRVCSCGHRFTTKEIVDSSKRAYKPKPIKALSMTSNEDGIWTVKLDENTPEWAKKMLSNL